MARKLAEAIATANRDRFASRTRLTRIKHSVAIAGRASENPRWNAVKTQAWKTGRQLRDALARGEMVVRPADAMLVPAGDRDNGTQKQAIAPLLKPQFVSQLVLVS